MNILHKGRLYSDAPAPFTGIGDNYGIGRVSLKVARGDSEGRWEAFENSRPLMTRLNVIGLTEALEIKAMTIAGKPVHRLMVRALSLYLKGCKGLTSFRRENLIWATRSNLNSLLSQVGFPSSHHVLRPQPPTEVSALAENTGRLGETRNVSPDWGQRAISQRGDETLGRPDSDDTTQESLLGVGRSPGVPR